MRRDARPRAFGWEAADRSRRLQARRLGRRPRRLQTVVQAQSGAHGGRAHRQRCPSPGSGGAAGRGSEKEAVEKATRRGNYESGSDYVLEYGELRFSFNEEDFSQRVEQAAVKLDFVEQGLRSDELHDLLELAVNGEIMEPSSTLGEHIVEQLDRAGRPRQPQPRPLDPAARLPRRLARPAGQGGRARRRLQRRHPHLRLRPARPRRRADRTLTRALLGSPRLQALEA